MEFTTQERKKAFDKIFKKKILPFFIERGFSRHTPGSKRIFKELGNQLSVFIFLEFKRFGHGFYDMSIVYFDAEMGDLYNDMYLAMAKIKTPNFQGNNVDELSSSVDMWLEELERKVLPFINNHSKHASLLEADSFYISPAREKEVKALIMRKS